MTDARRAGFTMLTVLWVMSVASVVAAAAALSGRVMVNAARNRVALDRAQWMALGCMARARAAIDSSLASATSLADAELRWVGIDRNVEGAFEDEDSSCDVTLEPAGIRMDVNAASGDVLRRLFESNGIPGAVDSLVDAILDWRDSDDVALPNGAEREWYLERGRKSPSNRAFADIRELRLVRGFESDSEAWRLLSTEPGRVSLAHAPISVLLGVPGITPEAAAAIIATRDTTKALVDLTMVAASLSRSAAESLSDHYPEAVRMTAASPDAWIVTASATTGNPRVAAALRARLVRTGSRAMVARMGSVR